jgi:putative ABC transport system ATP-binding protein
VTVLDARDLYRFYHTGDEEVLALRGVSLRVDEGEIVVVVGPSGSGKSTLLACVAGLDEPDGGAVLLLGRMLTRRSERQRAALRAGHVGILLQSGNLLDGLSVEDNIRLQMALAHRSDRQRVDALLARVGMVARRHARPGELSGGEAARASFAAALANDPALLLADEPTGEVDATAEMALLDLLDRRRAEGGAALIVTHSDALAARANRVLRLEDGRLRDA